MVTFAFKELEPLVASGTISVEACRLLTNRIVKKAQGVFLWVHLVLRSVATGIMNEDPEELLLRRLDRLPSELADLYAEMWRRMNEDSPYAEVAARYFHYVLYSDESLEIAFYSLETSQYCNRYHGPMLLQIVCAEQSNLQEFLIRLKVDKKYADLMQLCNETKKGIEVRCAGLLQTSHQTFRKSKHATPSSAKEIWPLRLEFIHRTAHDFLTNTEEGRNILQLHKQTPGETRISLFKGLLSLACIHFYKYGARAKLSSFLSDLHGLYETLEPHHGYEKNELLELLPILKRLYENNVVGDMVSWRPNPEFLTHLAQYPLFRGFIISTLSEMSLPKLVATQVLQETCQLPTVTGQRNDFLHLKKLTEYLLSVGAEPHFFEICPRSFGEVPFVHKKSAFLNLLENAVHVTFHTREYQESFIAWALPLMLDMSATCPDLEASILSCFDVAPHHNSQIGRWFHVRYPQIRLVNQFCIIFEVRLSFLVAYVITRLKPYTKEIANAMRIDKVLTCLQVSSLNFLYVIRGHETAPTPQICERVSNGSSCQELTDTLFQLHGGRPELLASYGEDHHNRYALIEIIWSMTRLLTLERADLEISMLSLTEKELNFYSLPQLCIISSSSWFEEVKGSGCSDIFPRTLKELRELSEKTLEEAHVSE
ncbi:uncharacterized protein FTJAE_10501 [Fusarium tjaetaba]|uniref:DUF7791 domain-containing protein n=1 Tax=Fusarium tjaetaba TaxID=1567544 RepID=A0A8H5QZU2_9HYPO|nr:uncharacterized protein FTJAE_10501 [Fusarium tjaetaba]KAF5623954.1 hypothetical protein FTJAE_10501 [Fusarium tjaetaba]